MYFFFPDDCIIWRMQKYLRINMTQTTMPFIIEIRNGFYIFHRDKHIADDEKRPGLHLHTTFLFNDVNQYFFMLMITGLICAEPFYQGLAFIRFLIEHGIV